MTLSAEDWKNGDRKDVYGTGLGGHVELLKTWKGWIASQRFHLLANRTPRQACSNLCATPEEALRQLRERAVDYAANPVPPNVQHPLFPGSNRMEW